MYLFQWLKAPKKPNCFLVEKRHNNCLELGKSILITCIMCVPSYVFLSFRSAMNKILLTTENRIWKLNQQWIQQTTIMFSSRRIFFLQDSFHYWFYCFQQFLKNLCRCLLDSLLNYFIFIIISLDTLGEIPIQKCFQILKLEVKLFEKNSKSFFICVEKFHFLLA